MGGGQNGPAAFLAALGLLFGGYDVGELALACRTGQFGEWLDRALAGAAGSLVGGLFACCSYHLLLAAGGAEGLGGAPAPGGRTMPAIVRDAPGRPATLALPEKEGPPPLA